MSPEEELCRRVERLSGAPGVPPLVSLQLGQAVARYRQESAPPCGYVVAWWLGLVILTVVVWAGVALLYLRARGLP